MESIPKYIPNRQGFYRSQRSGLSYPPITSKVNLSSTITVSPFEKESVKILKLRVDSYIENLERYISKPSPFAFFISQKIKSIKEVVETLRERVKEDEDTPDLGEIKGIYLYKTPVLNQELLFIKL